MTPSCEYCTNLSIERLVEIAKFDFRGDHIPREAYYQHHDSIQDLEQAADTGCAFCCLILRCLKGYRAKNERSAFEWVGEWVGEDCYDPNTLYSVASQLPISDIKIAITSLDVKSPATLSEVHAFDTLLVQVGPLWTPTSEQDADSAVLSLIRLTISTPRIIVTDLRTISTDDPVYIGSVRIGRFEVEPDLGCDSNHAIGRAWLHECQTEHASCLMDIAPILPTRVLDVGPKDNLTSLRLVHSKAARGRYVALSHCWGGKIESVLSTGTLETIQNGVLCSDLPANFRDAVSITRQLGIRFLWIDSLCIFQDSKQDWERESKRMGSIYRNSTVTISALSSAGSTLGILRSGAKPTFPTSIQMRVHPMSDSRSHLVRVQRQDTNEETLSYLDRHAPLSHRGWAFQETLLSTRHIFYGREQIYWRCPAGFKTADGMSTGIRVPDNRLSTILSALHTDALREQPVYLNRTLLQDYYKMIEEYSFRKLTFPSDKLPAISGLSQRLHWSFGGKYLAGIWSYNIAVGLLWKPAQGRSAEHVSPYRAPSWSWAVTDEPIQFTEDKGLTYTDFSMVLVSEQITRRDITNPYGEISAICIVVKGRTVPLVRSTQFIEGQLGHYFAGFGQWDEAQPVGMTEAGLPRKLSLSDLLFVEQEEEGVYILSVFSVPQLSDPGSEIMGYEIDFDAYSEEEYLALIVHVDDEDDGEGYVTSPAKGLILKPAEYVHEDGFESYVRVGTFSITSLMLSRLRTFGEQTLALY